MSEQSRNFHQTLTRKQCTLRPVVHLDISEAVGVVQSRSISLDRSRKRASPGQNSVPGSITGERQEVFRGYTNVSSTEIVATAIDHVINSDSEFLKIIPMKTSWKTEKETKTQPKAAGA
jgi:hypothetical protein